MGILVSTQYLSINSTQHLTKRIIVLLLLFLVFVVIILVFIIGQLYYF